MEWASPKGRGAALLGRLEMGSGSAWASRTCESGESGDSCTKVPLALLDSVIRRRVGVSASRIPAQIGAAPWREVPKFACNLLYSRVSNGHFGSKPAESSLRTQIPSISCPGDRKCS